MLVSCKKDDDSNPDPDTETKTLTDSRDNQEYNIVEIGDQTWMAENLNYDTGDTNSTCYEESTDSCDKYGKLYRFEILSTVCPNGYHVPTDADWKVLEEEIGVPTSELDNFDGRGTVAEKLKPGGSTGFEVQYSGIKINDSYFNIGSTASLWTSDTVSNGDAISRDISASSTKTSISRETNEYNIDNLFYCVRCLKD